MSSAKDGGMEINMNITELLKNYLDEQGRVKVYPSKHKYKTLVLFYLAAKFEQEKAYTELQVNNIIKASHLFNDHCLLRRALVNYGFLTRADNGTIYMLSENQPNFDDFPELSTI